MTTVKKYTKSVVENLNLYAPKLVSKEEFFNAGHRAARGVARRWRFV